MNSMSFRARLGATALGLFAALLLPGALAADQSLHSSPAGPDDDLGTLPASNSGGTKPPRAADDDLGTLPLIHEEQDGPAITLSGPLGTIQGLLSGMTGPGKVLYGPGPLPGTVTAYLEGDLRVPLLLDDLRLAEVRIELRSGSLPSMVQLQAGGQSSGAVALPSATRLGLPLQAYFAGAGLPASGRRLRFDLLDAIGGTYRLAVRAHGSFLLLEQSRS